MSEDFDITVKRRKKAGEQITVVEVVYAATSDADRRRAAAINLLLRAGEEFEDEAVQDSGEESDR